MIVFALPKCTAKKGLNRQPASSVDRLAWAVLVHLLPILALTLALPQAPAMGASQTALNIQKMLEFNNAERSARGIRTLSRNSTLDAEAQRWAQKLAAEGDMYHRPSTYALSVGFRSGAENLAWHDSSISASQAHNMWMDSSTHRRNMLDPAFHAAGFGIACSTKSGRPYAIAVVEFGGDAAPSQSTPAASPQVAGGQTMTGVGCSGGADQGPLQPPPPPPASSISPVTAAPQPPPPTTAGPARTLAKQAPSSSPTALAGRPTPSTSPVAKAATKPAAPPTAGDPQAIAGTKPEIDVPSEPTRDETGQPPEDSGAEQTKLASARSGSSGTDTTRLLLTLLGTGAAYLFLLRVFGIRTLAIRTLAIRTLAIRTFGIRRPQRHRYSPKHSSR